MRWMQSLRPIGGTFTICEEEQVLIQCQAQKCHARGCGVHPRYPEVTNHII